MRSSPSYFVLLSIRVDRFDVLPGASLGVYGIDWQNELGIRFCLTSPPKGSIISLYESQV